LSFKLALELRMIDCEFAPMNEAMPSCDLSVFFGSVIPGGD